MCVTAALQTWEQRRPLQPSHPCSLFNSEHLTAKGYFVPSASLENVAPAERMSTLVCITQALFLHSLVYSFMENRAFAPVKLISILVIMFL